MDTKKTGIAVGGPAHGRELSAHKDTIAVPVILERDLSGYGQAIYRWTGVEWRYDADITRH